MQRLPQPRAACPAYPPRRTAWALGLLGGVAVVSAGLTGCGARRAPVGLSCPGDMVEPGSSPVEQPVEPGVDGDLVPVEPEHLDGEMPAPAPDPDEARIPGGMMPPQEPVEEAPAPEGD